MKEAPRGFFVRGAFVPSPPNIDDDHLRTLPPLDLIDRCWVIDDASARRGVLAVVRDFGGEPTRLALAGDLDAAAMCATRDVEKVQLVCALAVAGHIEFARQLLFSGYLARNEQMKPLVVAAIECFRVGDIATSQGVLDTLCRHECVTDTHELHLATGLLGRIPWVDYPF